jgi:hypothetical protein
MKLEPIEYNGGVIWVDKIPCYNGCYYDSIANHVAFATKKGANLYKELKKLLKQNKPI